jgi:hypothetical protein
MAAASCSDGILFYYCFSLQTLLYVAMNTILYELIANDMQNGISLCVFA